MEQKLEQPFGAGIILMQTDKTSLESGYLNAVRAHVRPEQRQTARGRLQIQSGSPGYLGNGPINNSALSI